MPYDHAADDSNGYDFVLDTAGEMEAQADAAEFEDAVDLIEQ